MGSNWFCKSLADEVAKYGIRVTNVMPGMMKTDMFNKMNVVQQAQLLTYAAELLK